MTKHIEEHRLAVLAAEINDYAAAAESAWNSAVAHAIETGERLIEAKSLVSHGEWLPWLEANCRLAARTARAYMRLARNRQRVADLPTIRDALEMLSPPQAPERDAAIRAEVLERHQRGVYDRLAQNVVRSEDESLGLRGTLRLINETFDAVDPPERPIRRPPQPRTVTCSACGQQHECSGYWTFDREP